MRIRGESEVRSEQRASNQIKVRRSGDILELSHIHTLSQADLASLINKVDMVFYSLADSYQLRLIVTRGFDSFPNNRSVSVSANLRERNQHHSRKSTSAFKFKLQKCHRTNTTKCYSIKENIEEELKIKIFQLFMNEAMMQRVGGSI